MMIVTTFSLYAEDKAMVARLAEDAGCSRSAVVRLAIRHLAAQNEASRPDGNRTARGKSLNRSDREPEATAVT